MATATVLLDTTNTEQAFLNPAFPTVFGLAQPTLITLVYVDLVRDLGLPGLALPGLSLTLVDIGTGAQFGPFLPEFSPGLLGAGEQYEEADFFPFVVLGPGRYQIVPATSTGVFSNIWLQNPRSGGQGFARVEGVPIGVIAPPSGTTSPVAAPPLNQYERANWATSAGSSQRILSLQLLGGSTSSLTYLALYRITNSENSSRATVTTSHGAITLEPGRSVDVSTQEVKISSLKHARGTYQNICCALGTVGGRTAPKGGSVK